MLILKVVITFEAYKNLFDHLHFLDDLSSALRMSILAGHQISRGELLLRLSVLLFCHSRLFVSSF